MVYHTENNTWYLLKHRLKKRKKEKQKIKIKEYKIHK